MKCSFDIAKTTSSFYNSSYCFKKKTHETLYSTSFFHSCEQFSLFAACPDLGAYLSWFISKIYYTRAPMLVFNITVDTCTLVLWTQIWFHLHCGHVTPGGIVTPDTAIRWHFTKSKLIQSVILVTYDNSNEGGSMGIITAFPVFYSCIPAVHILLKCWRNVRLTNSDLYMLYAIN